MYDGPPARRMLTALRGKTMQNVRVDPQLRKCAAVGGQRTCPMHTESVWKMSRSECGSDWASGSTFTRSSCARSGRARPRRRDAAAKTVSTAPRWSKRSEPRCSKADTCPPPRLLFRVESGFRKGALDRAREEERVEDAPLEHVAARQFLAECGHIDLLLRVLEAFALFRRLQRLRVDGLDEIDDAVRVAPVAEERPVSRHDRVGLERHQRA